MNTVKLGTLEPGQTFRCPWRREGADIGKLLSIGGASAYVHAPNQEGTGWEKTTWSLGTEVVPCTENDYTHQSLGDGGGRMMNRSSNESPVETVHRICNEMEGASRDEIVAECVKLGVNINTARTQYYKWRRG